MTIHALLDDPSVICPSRSTNHASFAPRSRAACSGSDKVHDHGTFTLDPTAKPRAIDITEDAGPNKGVPNRGIYLLDLDAYREEPEAFDAHALLERAERFHARIESVFAWALTEAYLRELETGASPAGGES